MGRIDVTALIHPLTSCNLSTYVRLYRRYRPYSPESRRVRATIGAVALLQTPLYWLESLIYGSRINSHELTTPPTFIVGHWRSGTTHLHNIISETNDFATLSFAQAIRPQSAILGRRSFRRLMQHYAPEDRNFDKVAISPDTPQEEEMALTTMGTVSAYNMGIFHRNRSEITQNSLHLKSLPNKDRKEFLRNYQYLAKKVSYMNGGKPLLFKNPACTARMDFLSEAFPGARFIHIIRRPSHVVRSYIPVLDELTRAFTLHGDFQSPALDEIVENYRQLMQAHLEQRKKLPSNHYSEVRYEDLRDDPIDTIESIYRDLNWDLSDNARAGLNDYIKSISNYQSNKRPDDPELVARIEDKLAFAYETWGYEPQS